MAQASRGEDCFSRASLVGAMAAIVVGFLARGGFSGLGLAVLILAVFFGVWNWSYQRCRARVAAAVAAAPDAGVAAPADAPAAPPPPAPRTAPPAPSPEMVRAAMGLPAPSKPAMLAAARGGVSDDLKRIKGIGPKLEVMLHRMGVHHFDQIAGWTDAEIAWVDDNLEGFKGRVTRDAWVAQARILADGGITEFAARVDRGDVPTSQA
jgi:NADH-quinone oxidoreductase subunit E